MSETLEEIKRFIFEVALSPEELERLKFIQEALRVDKEGRNVNG